jgi:hypothetical protein
MIQFTNKTSLQVAEQLPEFVRDDVNYQTFVSFIEAYYAWLETTNAANSISTIARSTGQGVSYGSKNILNYVDVDNTLDDFVTYFINDFLPYIPEDALADKKKLLKISKELYKTKGIEKSYKFLFRALYNSAVETFNTSDQILRASDGKWIVPRSVKIESLDDKWLLIENLRLFGESSKAYAVVDYAKKVGLKTEIFISSLQRTFVSGEYIRVVDNNNLDVYYLDGNLYFQNQGYSIPESATTITDKIFKQHTLRTGKHDESKCFTGKAFEGKMKSTGATKMAHTSGSAKNYESQQDKAKDRYGKLTIEKDSEPALKKGD